jgi:hypothetical protein
VVAGLRGDNLLLDVHQKLLRFGQPSWQCHQDHQAGA